MAVCVDFGACRASGMEGCSSGSAASQLVLDAVLSETYTNHQHLPTASPSWHAAPLQDSQPNSQTVTYATFTASRTGNHGRRSLTLPRSCDPKLDQDGSFALARDRTPRDREDDSLLKRDLACTNSCSFLFWGAAAVAAHETGLQTPGSAKGLVPLSKSWLEYLLASAQSRSSF